MGRSGYSDDCDDNWAIIRWRGAVNSAIKGRRGQAFLKELLAAMDAMPVKALIANELVCDGQFCTLGVIGNARGIELEKFDPYDTDIQAEALLINVKIVQEIAYENDECGIYYESPEDRFNRMRYWVASQIKSI